MGASVTAGRSEGGGQRVGQQCCGAGGDAGPAAQPQPQWLGTVPRATAHLTNTSKAQHKTREGGMGRGGGVTGESGAGDTH
jgi:hypothetical protein